MIKRKPKGVGLIELMIGLVLSIIVMLGIVGVTAQILRRGEPVRRFLNFEDAKLQLKLTADMLKPCDGQLYYQNNPVQLPLTFLDPALTSPIPVDEIRMEGDTVLQFSEQTLRINLNWNGRLLSNKDMDGDGVDERRILTTLSLESLETPGLQMEPALQLEVIANLVSGSLHVYQCSASALPSPTPTPTPTPTLPPAPCKEFQDADIMFVLDRSSSTTPTQLAEMKTAILDLIAALNLSATNTRIGVVSFCANAVLSHTLTSDSSALAQSILNISDPSVCPWSGGPLLNNLAKGAYRGGTNIADGLRLASQELQSHDPLRSKQIVLLTDGAPNTITEMDQGVAHYLFTGNSTYTHDLDTAPGPNQGIAASTWPSVEETRAVADLIDNSNIPLYVLGIGLGITTEYWMWYPFNIPGNVPSTDPKITNGPDPRLPVGYDPSIYQNPIDNSFDRANYLANWVATTTKHFFPIASYGALKATLDLKDKKSEISQICENPPPVNP